MREIPLRAQVYQHCAINITADSTESIVRALQQDGGVDSPTSNDMQKSSRRDSRSPVPTRMTVPETPWSAVACIQCCVLQGPTHRSASAALWKNSDVRAAQISKHARRSRMVYRGECSRMPSMIASMRELRQSKSRLPQLHAQARDDTSAAWIEVWHQLVRQYSQCPSSAHGIELLGVSGSL
jgi:hypothetical protein